MIKRFYQDYIKYNLDLLPLIAAPFAIVALVVGIVLGIPYAFNIYPFGPQSTETITIERLYVDVTGKTSNYMIGSNKGVFEMDNSMILGIYNIDELYSNLEVGQTYEVKTKGEKVLNFLIQSYPHITEAVAVK
jgi:hypothetical protein